MPCLCFRAFRVGGGGGGEGGEVHGTPFVILLLRRIEVDERWRLFLEPEEAAAERVFNESAV